MRTPHFHIPHIAWPHLSGPRVTSLPHSESGRWRRPIFLGGADILAFVLAITLAAAVGAAVTLWMQG